jgi:hypothetical protein
MATSAKVPWKAVGVVPGKEACEAAQKLRSQRFLTREAPRLPLPDCTNQDKCQCKYQHFASRRHRPRRATDEGRSSSAPPSEGERRRPGERRERRR